MRISKLYGLELYNTKGEYIGIINDIILEVKEGDVFGLAVGQEKGIDNIATLMMPESAITTAGIYASRSKRKKLERIVWSS
mgnify:CR=1 FL=1